MLTASRSLVFLGCLLAGCRDPVILDDVVKPVDETTADVFDSAVADMGPRTDVLGIDTITDTVDTGTSSMDVPVLDIGTIDVGTSDTGSDAGVEASVDAAVLSPNLIPERRVTCGARVGTPSVTAGAADRIVYRGKVVTPTAVIPNGEVFTTGATITCAAASCATSTGYVGATIIETGGIIYPGLVNAHDHVAYDFLPPWPPPRLYNNRGQWQSSTAYDAFIQPYRTGTGTPDHTCAMTKYGEVRALVGGTTSIQGSPNRRCVTQTLVRNLEHGPDFNNIDVVRTYILDISSINATTAASVRMQIDSGAVLAYIIHLSEGIDEPSRMEFDELVAKNLLTPATVVIHGTAFGANEFRQMAAVGAKLVWSPRSNVILYGRTTNIPLALANNISVSIAPDWTPSGGPTMFAEMRYARYVSQTLWGGNLTNHDLFDMATLKPARAAARGASVGSLEVGKQADILVLPDYGCDAYDSFVNGVSADIVMTSIAGKPMYGDATLMNALPATLQSFCEDFTSCGAPKRICVSEGPTAADLTDQTLAAITAEVESFYTPAYPLVPFCP